MTPDIEKIEHLLNAKTFEELNTSERKLVLANLTGKAEYDHMRETLLRVKKVFNTEAQAMQTDAVLKEQILNRFEQNKLKSVSIFDQISIFFQTLIPSPAGRFSAVLSILLVVITIGYFALPKDQQEVAQNIQDKENPIKLEEPANEVSPAMEPITFTKEEALENKDAESKGDVSSYFTTVDDLKLSDQNYARDEVVTVDNIQAKEETVTEKYREENQTQKAPNFVEQSPRTYTNAEGYEQYNIQNNRSASLPQKENYSDVTKNVSQRNKKTNESKEKAKAETAKISAVGKADGEADKSVAPSGAGNGQVVAGVPAEAEIKSTKPSTSTPAWYGDENSNDANYVTTSKIKSFLLQELSNTSIENLKGKQIKLQLQFNPDGYITKANVLNSLPEATKKEIETKSLKLPAFRFSNEHLSKKVLEQNYTITF